MRDACFQTLCETSGLRSILGAPKSESHLPAIPSLGSEVSHPTNGTSGPGTWCHCSVYHTASFLCPPPLSERGKHRLFSMVTKQQLFQMLTQSRCWTSGPNGCGSGQASKHPLPSLTTSWPGGRPCSFSGPSELRDETGKTQCFRDNYFQAHW